MSLRSLSATLTRRSRSNVYYAFLTLPRPRRDALYAVYAFCRIVDDVADLGRDPSAQRGQLARWREDVARCFEPGPPPDHPVARQLAAAVRAYPIPRSALEAIIDGCEMDLARARYETFEDLRPYCYRV
ncbi:MAG TPA: squalene/phytoene synthase family protein, partial [Methylomirabilota bacterium]|nr:squalene/phytoene synthase family protein [Methylomirabilota bacterium]